MAEPSRYSDRLQVLLSVKAELVSLQDDRGISYPVLQDNLTSLSTDSLRDLLNLIRRLRGT